MCQDPHILNWAFVLLSQNAKHHRYQTSAISTQSSSLKTHSVWWSPKSLAVDNHFLDEVTVVRTRGDKKVKTKEQPNVMADIPATPRTLQDTADTVKSRHRRSSQKRVLLFDAHE
jgi:hypothetical protein